VEVRILSSAPFHPDSTPAAVSLTVALCRVCLVMAITLAPGTMTAQGRGGQARPRDPDGHTVGRRGAATPKPVAGRDRRRAPSPARRHGGNILLVPLPADSIEAEPDSEDTTPRPLAPAGPPVESSSIQPPFQPTATAGAAQGSLRGNLWLDVEPSSAQVYVDGFYSGTVADCQRSPAGLKLATGWHRLEFRAPGFETPAIHVTVETDRTTRYRGELKPTRP
jgi:hypothetical protein